jgi:hypothetical protein
MIAVSRSKGSAYIICDLNGTLLHAPVAAFRVVSYPAHTKINIPDLKKHIDVLVAWLREMEHNTVEDPNNPEENDRHSGNFSENSGNSSEDKET